MKHTVAWWADTLTAFAAQTLDGAALSESASLAARSSFAEQFTDEFGVSRPLDRLVVAAALQVTPEPLPDHATPEYQLWHTVASGTGRLPDFPAGGPLMPDRQDEGIESWTEAELAALHAIDRLGSWDRPDLRARAEAAARWHILETQPDNATNRPWAIQVFARLACADDPDAALAAHYAETLLHNCRIAFGQPDRVSACLLLDAARALRQDTQAG